MAQEHGGMSDAARLRITLLDLDPAPWREIDVPLSMTFKGLHEAIQAAFLWFDAHLWEFEFDGRIYGLPFDGDNGERRIYKADVARLTKLRQTPTGTFYYTYDMGDFWVHRIEVLKLFVAEQGARLPRFLTGQWRTPPEDIGGPPGFAAFCAILNDPSHPGHDDLLDWFGGPFDPIDIEDDIIHIQMGRLANMRQAKP